MSQSDQVEFKLAESFASTDIHREMRKSRYKAGDVLSYAVKGVTPATEAHITVEIDKFVGGGFAGQVYRVRVTEISGGTIEGLKVGSLYAVKILIPPAAGSVRFRNFVYFLGFQGPFSLQSNLAAARAGALWQKFIRRAASIEVGDENSVVDIYATFVDETFGSCGEISEWIEGRNWAFEVDENLQARKDWAVGDALDTVGAPEYLAKKTFMAKIVELFHKVGAPELARQYEWWTCKSQPNCLKRVNAGDGPANGLTAVDFRAGLALLCWLPMSPGDILLIFRGLTQRGALVQFDRGNVATLKKYIEANSGKFDDMADSLAELSQCEDIYRNSLIDITHNHLRLLYSPKLWRGIFSAAVESWKIRRIADEKCTQTLSRSKIMCMAFALCGFLSGLGSTLKSVGLLGLITSGAAAVFSDVSWAGNLAKISLLVFAGGLVSAIVGRSARTMWGRADLRRHYKYVFTSLEYLKRTLKARRCESATLWLADGRLTEAGALKLVDSPLKLLVHLPLSVLPAWLHRWITDPVYALGCIKDFVTHPVKLYFNAELRTQWMSEMLDDGLKKGMVTADEAKVIRNQLDEPFIQKYLKSLAVHVCTLPITQIISVLIAFIYWDKADTWEVNMARAGMILALFQVVPLSPGSLTRGLYVVYMALKDRSYKKYSIALWLGFWKYIGYLSFPIQMAHTYPEIARFMAGRWATGAVHIIPVFGEHGALAEHAVFDLFYNRPLSIRRKMAERAEKRAGQKTNFTQLLPAIAIAWVISLLPAIYNAAQGNGFSVVSNYLLLAAGCFVAGKIAARYAGGAKMSARLLMGMFCAIASSAISIVSVTMASKDLSTWEVAKPLLIPTFGVVLCGVIGALLDELRLKD